MRESMVSLERRAPHASEAMVPLEKGVIRTLERRPDLNHCAQVDCALSYNIHLWYALIYSGCISNVLCAYLYVFVCICIYSLQQKVLVDGKIQYIQIHAHTSWYVHHTCIIHQQYRQIHTVYFQDTLHAYLYVCVCICMYLVCILKGGRSAPSPNAGSLPLLLMIIKLVCVCILKEMHIHMYCMYLYVYVCMCMYLHLRLFCSYVYICVCMC